ncbi:MAG: hypothetical protein KDA60_21995 [Planctomycetales bacterium]|nr:hypothetical protein [Planctomycetales bacterium]
MSRLLPLVVLLVAGSRVGALTVSLDNLAFAPADSQTNTLAVTVDAGVAGSDQDSSIISGFLTADIQVDVSTGTPFATGLGFTGGDFEATDMNFRLAAGLLTAGTRDVGGTMRTPSPPSVVRDERFEADDHELVLDRGELSAPSYLRDLFLDPLVAVGTGQGILSLSPVGGPDAEHNLTLDVQLVVPQQLTQEFQVDLGFRVLDVTLDSSVTVVATQQITIPVLPGDYDSSGTLDCTDLDYLTSVLDLPNAHEKFDANDDGEVDLLDVQTWVEQFRQAKPGDANLDDVVDANDFERWQSNLFTANPLWCDGDFNFDGNIDGLDFNIWLANRSDSALNAVAVPEPHSFGLLLLCAFGWWRHEGRSRRLER